MSTDASTAAATPPASRRYGCIRDTYDSRDYLYAPLASPLTPLPPAVNLRPHCPRFPRQGSLGSCTSHAIAFHLLYCQMHQRVIEPFLPSRLFIYYNERAIEGTIGTDAGAMLRDGIKSVATLGAPPEAEWPYDPAKFTQKPPDQAYVDGKRHPALQYQRIQQTVQALKTRLASGFPFVFGFTVFPSFESQQVANTGMAPMPGAGERPIGGHAVAAIGYSDAEQRFLCANWWGPWGDNEMFHIPYAYLANPQLAQDFWGINLVGV